MAQFSNGEAAKPITDESQLTIPQRDTHAKAQATVQYTDARTGEVKQRMSMAPQLLEIKKRMLAVAMQSAANASERTQIAKDTFNFDYKGLDQNGNHVFVDPETGETFAPKIREAQMKGEGKSADPRMAAQAQAIIESGDELKQMVQQLVDEGKIGGTQGIITRGGQAVKSWIGMDDPEVKGVIADLSYLASLQPKLHGMRGQKAMDDFKQTIGHINQNPESVLEGINRLQSMAVKVGNANIRAFHPGMRVPPPAAGGPKPPAPSPGGQGGQVTVYYKNKAGQWVPRQIPAGSKAAALQSGYVEKPQ
jgi:hypothetical protein